MKIFPNESIKRNFFPFTFTSICMGNWKAINHKFWSIQMSNISVFSFSFTMNWRWLVVDWKEFSAINLSARTFLFSKATETELFSKRLFLFTSFYDFFVLQNNTSGHCWEICLRVLNEFYFLVLLKINLPLFILPVQRFESFLGNFVSLLCIIPR